MDRTNDERGVCRFCESVGDCIRRTHELTGKSTLACPDCWKKLDDSRYRSFVGQYDPQPSRKEEVRATEYEINALRDIARDSALFLKTGDPEEHFAAQNRIIDNLLVLGYLQERPEGIRP